MILNLGCGYKKMIGAVNVDAHDICKPDIVHDLNVFPYPWAENSVDQIFAHHVFEHLIEWWDAFAECGRILKPGGTMEIKVPHASSDSALAYRDHVQIFTSYTFHGALRSNGDPFRSSTNAWARIVKGSVPLMFMSWHQEPFKKYDWMRFWCPWLLRFCADHMRNFIHEQVFIFKKIGGKNE